MTAEPKPNIAVSFALSTDDMRGKGLGTAEKNCTHTVASAASLPNKRGVHGGGGVLTCANLMDGCRQEHCRTTPPPYSAHEHCAA